MQRKRTKVRSSQHSHPKHWQQLCGAPDSEDGLDPKQRHTESPERPRAPRKTLQLCAQVADTLNQALAGDDDLLGGLVVTEVVPAPDATQLLVILAPVISEVPLDPRQTHERLAEHHGRLRTAVAQAISRRRAPRLVFQVLAALPQPPLAEEMP